MPGEELCIDYAQASNMEFLVRYGFRVEDNPYGGRQFDLGGEPLQAHCPMYILRYDTPDIIENATVDCHRQARYLSFEQQFGSIHLHEQLREDRYIYRAVEEACEQLLSMLRPPRPLEEYEVEERNRNALSDSITSVLLKEIKAEQVLLEKCVVEFKRRQNEPEPRPVPPTLAEPLARLRGQGLAADDMPQASSAHAGMMEGGGAPWSQRSPQSAAAAAAGGLGRAGDSGMDTEFARGRQSNSAPYGDAALSSFGALPGSFGMGGSANGGPTNVHARGSQVTAGIDAGGQFSTMVDRSKLDSLLQRLQTGTPLS